MKTRWLGIFLLLFHLGAAQKYTLEHQGKKRQYSIHLPEGYDPSFKYPLVMSFHGWGGNPDEQQRYTLLNEVANKEKFIVVYPKSVHHFWNAGILDNQYQKGRDDMDFVRKLLDRLSHDLSIDEDSVYAVGLSLGGMLCHRIGCELGDKIAAFASISGPMSDSTEKFCPLAGRMPMLYMHGTKDHMVKYKGNREYLGAEETVAFWRKYNTCGKADTIELPNISIKDKTKAELIKFKCNKNMQVWFVKIIGGGHTWPDAGLNYWYFGRTSKDFDGGQLMWDFFKQFSLKKEKTM